MAQSLFVIVVHPSMRELLHPPLGQHSAASGGDRQADCLHSILTLPCLEK